MDEKKMNKDEMDGKGSSGRKINENEPDVLAKFTNIFAGTFLEDFFALKEEDFLDPAMEKLKKEVVISKMEEAEKRVFTLMAIKHEELIVLAEVFGLNEDSLDVLLSAENDEIVQAIFEESERQYQELQKDFPDEVWGKFSCALDAYYALEQFLKSLVYTRLAPRFLCKNADIRKGFLIVKDCLELIEEEGREEDDQKIISQDFSCN